MPYSEIGGVIIIKIPLLAVSLFCNNDLYVSLQLCWTLPSVSYMT